MASDEQPAVTFLETLRTALAAAGLRSELISDAAWPRLRIRSPYETHRSAAEFENNVLAVQHGNEWVFCWPWCERIAAAGQIGLAVKAILSELADGDPGEDFGHDGGSPDCLRVKDALI